MKAVIFAGGFGTRISEESGVRPKPMVEIGGKPILWHIMKTYAQHGIDEFIICCGYKGYYIKEYFSKYFIHTSDFTFDLKNNDMEVHKTEADPWKVTLIDTGLHTMTGGRLKRVKEYIGNETFCLTYGDGVSDVNITELIKFHKSQGTAATLTAVQQPGRFGAFKLGDSNPKVNSFREKPVGDGRESAWINGGFFVLEPSVIDHITGDDTVWEREPLETLAETGNLSAYKHTGFWQPMDTLRDKNVLEAMWDKGEAPWKVW
ncbi:glucose-1-phosphate cytidylyltransferase [Chondrinema litorale]|uniref:glucose-1-phosphate cytidylyltransferase n=1 Tax=Chondrinema litorale TaxID=2994555 RepID=UPI0025448445|nr:glucose-1-phosphate cytidylyltransferase [Chondrinema litorale]UZR92624.1 glucose-1-phosphate cytidylyltransferase [Chondrinema litorale]